MTIRTALTAALITTLASAAAAQDFTALNGAFDAQLNAAMNGSLDYIVTTGVNDPQVQSMYQQAIQSGRYVGPIEQFAIDYAQSGGFSGPGMANLIALNGGLHGQHQQMMGDYWAGQQVYKDAFNGYAQGWSEIQYENGLMLNGQNTWIGPYGEQPLPHTWQPGQYVYQGQSYIVDDVGGYWLMDPYSGDWSLMTPKY